MFFSCSAAINVSWLQSAANAISSVKMPHCCILEQATRKLPGYMICHEQLLRLKYADEENGTEYLRTLRLYLDNHLNAVQTARELFIHRSTFLYRLERIKSILGTDLADPDEILYLMLSFRLMDRESRESGAVKEKAAGER